MLMSLEKENYNNRSKNTLVQERKKRPKNLNFTSMSRRTLSYSTTSTTPTKRWPLLSGGHTPTRGLPSSRSTRPCQSCQNAVFLVENAAITNITLGGQNATVGELVHVVQDRRPRGCWTSCFTSSGGESSLGTAASRRRTS